MRALAIAAAVLVACAEAGDAPDAGAGVGDAAPPDAPGDCPTWFADGDGDGHGDAAASTVACAMPAGHVASSDDCDDTSPYVHPGAAEVCDTLDNDCAAATVETCPGGCVVRARPETARTYLFCAVGAPWTGAQATCAGQAMRLARVDDAAEDAWLRATGNEALGAVQFWLGANDRAVEDVWVWDDGAQFWQGNGGGTPIAGLYTHWDGGEPNDDDGEDCGEIRADGAWNDVECNDSRTYVCERY